jgi:hypothetical protein
MQAKHISGYVIFGTGMRYLLDAKRGWAVHEKDKILDNLHRFFKYLEEFNLIVTSRAARELKEFTKEMEKSEAKHVLSEDEATRLRTIMLDIRKTLFAELQGRVAFVVTDKRIDVHKLMDNMGSLMAPDIFEALPEIAKYDFIQAGKCIAFEVPTAAAFHLLRGTEAVLRNFYRGIVKRKRLKDLLWKPMVEALRARRSPPSKALLDNLDNIRANYRNPTQHPEMRYNIEEVQDLFGLCIQIVNRMVKEYWGKKSKT